MNGPYDDIINLPHHVSATRPQMSSANRAAQFSPFAALTGYDGAIAETGRLTDKRIELDEYEIDDLNAKIRILADAISDHPQIIVTYFQPDKKKDGGEYIQVAGVVKKIDYYEGVITLMNGKKIAVADILDIKCKLFMDLV